MDFIDHISEISIRIILHITFCWLNVQTPFIRYINEDELWMYRYPSIPSLISKCSLYTLIVLTPVLMLLTEFVINQKPLDILKAGYALTLIYLLTGILTHTLKLLVGRPRPNFYMRCFPDGYGVDLNQCTGDWKSHMDGRKSFPSAHAAFAFSGMSFMALHLAQLLNIKGDCKQKGGRCLLVCIPILIAVVVAVSRTQDYHHHYSDVLFGALIGSAVSYFVYSCYYSISKNVEKLN